MKEQCPASIWGRYLLFWLRARPTDRIGCLEGVFAIGQVYVLISRCTDPQNFLLCGLPPKDLWDDVHAAFLANGLNARDCWTRERIMRTSLPLGWSRGARGCS